MRCSVSRIIGSWVLGAVIMPTAGHAWASDECVEIRCLIALLKCDANASLFLPPGTPFPSEYDKVWNPLKSCPKGGDITVGCVGQFPTCSKHGAISDKQFMTFVEMGANSSNQEYGAMAAYVLARDFGFEGNESRDMVKAIKYCKIAAAKDYAPAQYMLGYSYTMGHGVEKNEAEGMKLIQAAAAQQYWPAVDYLKKASGDEQANGDPDQAQGGGSSEKENPAERLRQAKRLLDEGLMSQDEYEAVRKRILNDL